MQYTASGTTAVNVKLLQNQEIGSDSVTHKVNVTNTTSAYIPVVRLSQNIGLTGGDNEVLTYTVSWTGGTWNASYSDTIAPSVNVYQNSTAPTGFIINNREIEGLATTGTITNGGSFTTYQVKTVVASCMLTYRREEIEAPFGRCGDHAKPYEYPGCGKPLVDDDWYVCPSYPDCCRP